MPRRADCASCGTPIQLGGGSLPPGQATCRDCRKVSRKLFDATKCGTRLGHPQHRYRGEPSCEPCKVAWNEACKVWRQNAVARGWTRPDRAAPRRPNCVVCGERVPGKATSDQPMHNACRPEKFWANAIQISDRDRLAIYERDGWICQLCDRPVGRDVDPIRDPMAATLDHIHPRSLTLFPDDSPENLRLAHRACNSARGNRVA